MRIGIDASRTTIGQRSGTEGYSLHLIRELLRIGGDHKFILYFRDEPHPDLFEISENIEIRILLRKHLWTHIALRKAVISDQPDVLFIPAHVVPLRGVKNVPVVITLHDLGYKHFPGKHPLSERLYLEWSTRYSARNSTEIIVHTKATRNDLITLESIEGGKINVVHSGVAGFLKPVKSEDEISRVLERYGIKHPYLLHVSRIEPRKNLTRLVQAFSELLKKYPDLQLVLTGRMNENYSSLKRAITGLADPDKVVITGFAPDNHLPALYSGSEVYVFPSLFEGFGFPVLEAMACGTPVVCSNTSSLPELVGAAALTVAPTSKKAIVDAISSILDDPGLREDLVKKGLEQAAKFEWYRTAEETMNVLVKAANRRNSK